MGIDAPKPPEKKEKATTTIRIRDEKGLLSESHEVRIVKIKSRGSSDIPQTLYFSLLHQDTSGPYADLGNNIGQAKWVEGAGWVVDEKDALGMPKDK